MPLYTSQESGWGYRLGNNL